MTLAPDGPPERERAPAAPGAPVYAVGVVVLAFAKYGAGVFVSANYLVELARNWRDPHQAPLLAPPADYLLSNPTSAVVAGMLGWDSERAFLGFHLALVVAALVLPFTLSTVRGSPQSRLAVAVLLAGGPVTAVLVSWVGSYDPVTVMAAAVATLSPLAPARALGWAVFAFNNAPQAAVAFAALTLVMCPELGLPRAVRSLVPGALGAAAGYVAIRALVGHWGGSTSRANWLAGVDGSFFVENALTFLPLIVFSALGAGWFLLLDGRMRGRPGVRVLLATAVAISCTLPFAVGDQSRVVSIVLWPALLWVVLHVVSTMEPPDARGVLVRWAPAAVVMPVVLVFADGLLYPGWRSLASLVRLVF